ncbi:MAG: zinc ribbon domain-containing protein, partial [Treponema sp.]|nr:zinc ribbon domain-containing protein [Treponema sp.]
CKYCFPNGAFSKDETLDEMVESCIPFRIKNYPDKNTAREKIKNDLSLLGRWKK